MVQRPAGFLFRSPKLLRNPGEAVAYKRESREAVGEQGNSLFAEDAQGHGIEAVAGGDPDAGMEPVAAKDLHSRANPEALGFFGDTGKLRSAMEGHQASAPAEAEVAIAVQADHGAGGLQSAHPGPEFGVWFIEFQFRVAIVRNDGENRADAVPLDHGEEWQPAHARHGWAEVVEAKQVLCRGVDHRAP